ncbi:MAG: 50S ribosomal protein L35 [bacterium]|nr:50S ribosomal protein L35 [bacterium]
MKTPTKTKLKSKKSFLKRFKVTKTGKVLHRVAFGNHLMRKKSKSQKRRYKKLALLKGVWAKKVIKYLGV